MTIKKSLFRKEVKAHCFQRSFAMVHINIPFNYRLAGYKKEYYQSLRKLYAKKYVSAADVTRAKSRLLALKRQVAAASFILS